MNELMRLDRSSGHPITQESAPSQNQVEKAFREVFRWIGEDPDRDGLRETPNRLARAFQEYFAGYRQAHQGFEQFEGPVFCLLQDLGTRAGTQLLHPPIAVLHL